MTNRLAFILGIRPDVIRAALIINQLRRYPDTEFVFIWSGQHYSDNLKSIFFRELDIAPAEIDLGCGG
jgi:UDP-N-acetylglucosamine 2-epimerase (non-hydrolysing)